MALRFKGMYFSGVINSFSVFNLNVLIFYEMIGDSREFFTYLLGESRLIEILFTNELNPSDKCECKLSFDQVTNV